MAIYEHEGKCTSIDFTHETSGLEISDAEITFNVTFDPATFKETGDYEIHLTEMQLGDTVFTRENLLRFFGSSFVGAIEDEVEVEGEFFE